MTNDCGEATLCRVKREDDPRRSKANIERDLLYAQQIKGSRKMCAYLRLPATDCSNYPGPWNTLCGDLDTLVTTSILGGLFTFFQSSEASWRLGLPAPETEPNNQN